jgi:hypothetical protein
MLVVAILAYGKMRKLRTVTIASSLGYTVAEADEEMRSTRSPELTVWLASELNAGAIASMNDIRLKMNESTTTIRDQKGKQCDFVLRKQAKIQSKYQLLT